MAQLQKNPIKEINPDVINLIKPIVETMTRNYMVEQQMKGQVGPNQPEMHKAEKLRCVHLIWKGLEPEPAMYITTDDKGERHMKCYLCQREIGMNFDDTAIKKLLDARTVIEQVMFYGMINHMQADKVEMLIQMKSIIPYIAQMAQNLNKFVAKDDSYQDSIGNVGREYRNSITSGGF